MKVHEAIYKRKSIRKYKDLGIEPDIMNKISDVSKSVSRLNENIDMNIHIVYDGKRIHSLFKGIVSNYVKIKSPHYLVITAENKENYLCNIGYTVENLVLEMTTMGIGTCWVGAKFKKEEMKKILDIKENEEPVILVAFGEPEDFFNMYRENISQFSRKKIDEVVVGKYNDDIKEILEAARLSPSACNLQPWSFKIECGEIQVFRNFPKNIIKKKIAETYGDIDVGIAISHVLRMCEYKNICYELIKGDIEDSNYVCSIKLC